MTERNGEAVYLAGGLFNAGERVHNILLKKALEKLGHKVILPQIEAVKFFNFETEKFYVEAIVEDCLKSCCSTVIRVVACSDGPDADSGTCVELGAAIGYARALNIEVKAVVYRTDFRTNLETESGVNAMLRAKGVVFIYNPCFIVEELKEIEPYYEELAQKIHEALSGFSVK